MGSRFTRSYINATGRVVQRELRWINQCEVDDNLFDLMSLYPGMRRVFFIHIPKCGGTSIRQSLVDDYKCAPVPHQGLGAIGQSIDYLTNSAPRKSLEGQFLKNYASQRLPEEVHQQYLRLFAGYIVTRRPKKMFVLGHKLAKDLKPLYRKRKDIFFTTVRAPSEILRSMVAYRVDHTLKNKNRPDSIELLKNMEMNHLEFSELVSSRPQALTERILGVKPPSLVAFLSMSQNRDHEHVWQGIRQNNVFIAHMSEQEQMLGKLFGERPRTHPKNTSSSQSELAVQFSAVLQNSWVEPFIDPDSSQLYQRLESSGIIGFWQKGGTVNQYRELLQNT